MNNIVRTKTILTKAQKGNMLVTAAITLGVMGIITLGAMKGFDKYAEAKVSNEIQELADLKSATVKYGQSLGSNFTNTNVAIATLAGLDFWEQKKVSGTGAGTVVSNQWGGTVTTSVGTAKNAGDAIDYTYTGYTGTACRMVATQVDGIAAKVTIGGTVVKAVGSPVNGGSVGTQCAAANDNATIVYTIAK